MDIVGLNVVDVRSINAAMKWAIESDISANARHIHNVICKIVQIHMDFTVNSHVATHNRRENSLWGDAHWDNN